jgi:hypothetical protein
MPVLLKVCFFACRDDFEPPANRSLTVTALFAACRFCYKLLNPKNARLKAGMAASKGRSTVTAPHCATRVYVMCNWY